MLSSTGIFVPFIATLKSMTNGNQGDVCSCGKKKKKSDFSVILRFFSKALCDYAGLVTSYALLSIEGSSGSELLRSWRNRSLDLALYVPSDQRED